MTTAVKSKDGWADTCTYVATFCARPSVHHLAQGTLPTAVQQYYDTYLPIVPFTHSYGHLFLLILPHATAHRPAVRPPAMPPDLNTLPPSPHFPPASTSTSTPSSMPTATATSRNQSPSASRTMSSSSPHSLAATAAMNAGIQSEDSRRLSSGSMRRDVERARRRSSVRMNLNLNDPAIPSPGEMQQSPPARSRGPWPHSPQHERAPSLGELHQELEYEQEGQVNRLLNMIRQQQEQITALQTNQQQPPSSSSAVDDSTPTSERSMSIPPSHPLSSHGSQSIISPLPSAAQPRSRSPLALGSISRQSSFADRSRQGSHAASPALRPLSGQAGGLYDHHDMLPAAATARDESAFYQAETQNLTRENQMLKLRIRELERQLAESNPTAQITHSPVIHSRLAPAASQENAGQGSEEDQPAQSTE